jgi:sterol 22-desaturase
MVILSFLNSMYDPEVFPSPETLNADCSLDPNSSVNLNQNYIVFSSRLQRRIGIEYAIVNITLVLSTASMLMGYRA